VDFEGLVEVYARDEGCRIRCSETCDAGASIGVDKNIRLDKCEPMIMLRMEEVTYDRDVPVNYFQFVHIFHTVCYVGQLASGW